MHITLKALLAATLAFAAFTTPAASSDDGFSSIEDFGSVQAYLQNCDAGLKVIIQPGKSYQYKLEPADTVEVTSSAGSLSFKHKDDTNTDPVTVTLQMPADSLTDIKAQSSVGVEIQPGFNVDTIALSAGGSAQIYSSSFCAKTISSLSAQGSGKINIAVPSDCGTMTISNANGSGSGMANIDSKGEVNGDSWSGSGSGGLSVSATGGTLNSLAASGSGFVFTKGITVGSVSASGSGMYSADKVTGSQNVRGGGKEEIFRSVALGMSASTLIMDAAHCTGSW